MEKSTAFVSNEGYLEEKYHYFHLRDTAGQERDFHFHEFDKLVILVSGRVNYAVENNLYSLCPGDILLVRHHTIHKAIIDKSEPYERVILYLDEGYFSDVLPDVRLTDAFAVADKENSYLLRPDKTDAGKIREKLAQYEAVSGKQPLDDALRETLIMQLLIQLNRITSALPARSKSAHDDKIEKILSYINSNLSEPLDIETLAKQVFLSKYHFMRIFKENVGYTVHDYIRQRRLLNASRLIREGTPAADAAAESGFSDYSVFYRAFRKTFGVAPGSMKRRNGRSI